MFLTKYNLKVYEKNAKNDHKKPYNVNIWDLGNEVNGLPWESAGQLQLYSSLEWKNMDKSKVILKFDLLCQAVRPTYKNIQDINISMQH